MTIDPCNPATLYVCVRGEESGLYRSVDGGGNWDLVSPENMCVHVAVDPEEPLHIYAVNGVGSGADGFWVTHDGGETWAVPAGFTEAAGNPDIGVYDSYHVEPDPTDFAHVLVSFHYYWQGDWGADAVAGVFESFDGGESWVAHAPDPGWNGAGGYGVFFLYEPTLGIGNAQTWLYGTQGVGYWRTNDAGETWTKVSDISMQHGGGQLYYTQEGILYAGGEGAILRSEDNGLTWTEHGPTGYYLSVIGDGERLYTGHHGGGKFITASEAEGDVWTEHPGASVTDEGPFKMRFDAHNRIMYSANIRAGVWALKLD